MVQDGRMPVYAEIAAGVGEDRRGDRLARRLARPQRGDARSGPFLAARLKMSNPQGGAGGVKRVLKSLIWKSLDGLGAITIIIPYI
jgi:hypothetical protein